MGHPGYYLLNLDMKSIQRYERELTRVCLEMLRTVPGVEIYGDSEERSSVVSFNLVGIHCHDVAQLLDRDGIAIRAGHHCAQPMMRKLELTATARTSLAFYNTTQELDRLVSSLRTTGEFFHHGI